MAREFIEKLKMDKQTFQIRKKDLSAEKKRKKELYYQLELNFKKIHFINKSEILESISMENSKYIGLDVEYLPLKNIDKKGRPSLLQVN